MANSEDANKSTEGRGPGEEECKVLHDGYGISTGSNEKFWK